MQAAEFQAKPPLSIIVPVLNEARQMPALLDHLQHWQDRGCEILLADGGSTDGSPQQAESRGFIVVHSERGRARQMNAGAQQTTGDILLFLHADTRLPPQADVLIQSALVIESNYWGRFDVSIDGDHWLLPVIAWLMNWRSCFTGIATGDQAIFVSASTFKAIGGYADIPLMEDIQLSKDLRQQSPPVCLGQQVSTSGRRWMANGVWRTIWLMWRLRWAYWRGVPAENLAAIYQ